MIGAAWMCVLVALAQADDDASLSLVDLPAYRRALDSPADSPAEPAEFRDLWGHPEAFRGRRVLVRGTIRRVFRQGAVGAFPPLIEAWAVTPQGDPYCLVFAEPGVAASLPAIGSDVRFAGTYLKRVRYQGGDVPRLAPLIVGPAPPIRVAGSPVQAATRPLGGGLDWSLGLIVAAFVALALARQHLRRPPPRRPKVEWPPEFLDGDD